MQPLPSWTNPLALQIAPNLKKSPSTELQRRENSHENEYWQHFQQQGDGAGIPCAFFLFLEQIAVRTCSRQRQYERVARNSLLVENVPNHFIGVLVGFRLAFA